mmetsp:Transcript_19565/g.48102  ORF Transcript_19565/g.48102 Transcript_19565/m.48102 type:complete len:87 (+) Transcript_19565:26-286(+)
MCSPNCCSSAHSSPTARSPSSRSAPPRAPGLARLLAVPAAARRRALAAKSSQHADRDAHADAVVLVDRQVRGELDEDRVAAWYKQE